MEFNSFQNLSKIDILASNLMEIKNIFKKELFILPDLDFCRKVDMDYFNSRSFNEVLVENIKKSNEHLEVAIKDYYDHKKTMNLVVFLDKMPIIDAFKKYQNAYCKKATKWRRNYKKLFKEEILKKNIYGLDEEDLNPDRLLNSSFSNEVKKAKLLNIFFDYSHSNIKQIVFRICKSKVNDLRNQLLNQSNYCKLKITIRTYAGQ